MKTSTISLLGRKVSTGKASIDDVAFFISAYMPDAVKQVNTIFAPRQLVKRSRGAEPLPTDKRQLSSYRTRLGTMLEYALSTHIDKAIERHFGADLRLTFAVAHEYPDFFVRDAVLGPRIRIEMKAVDKDSDEQAARFEVLTGLIQGNKDVVVLVGWEWRACKLRNKTECEYPEIFSYVVVPAAALASERDISVKLRGGRIEDNAIMVRSKTKPGTLSKDQGNAGKVLRIVHKSRRCEPFKLSEYIQRYLQFVSEIAGRDSKRKNSL